MNAMEKEPVQAMPDQAEQPRLKSAEPRDWSILTDNPIIIKQARVRLKRSSVVSWMMIIGVLSLAVIWMEFQFNTKRYDRSAGYILGGMIFMMLIVGATALGQMITVTRASGMIDFHRLSPQSPRSLLFGFMLGGPIREYAMVLFAIPFLTLACVLYGTPLLGLLQILIAIFMLTLLMHSLTVVSSMLTKNPNPAAAKGAAWGVFASMGMLGPLISGTMAVDRVAADPMKVSFFGLPVQWPLLFSAIAAVPILFFMIAGVRRFRDDHCPSLTKKQGLAAFASFLLIGLGLLFNLEYRPRMFQHDLIRVIELIAIGFWIFTSFILIATASPERIAYIGGLRRSLRLGLRRPGAFDDRALNRWALLCYAALMSAALSCFGLIRHSPYDDTPLLPGATSATAVLVVLEFGLALQYFRLRLGKYAGGGMALFFFIAWFLPFMLGMAITLASTPDQEISGMLVMSISPIFGIPLGSGGTFLDEVPVQSCQLAALLPTLSAVFIFNQMITSLQRRIDRRIMPEHQTPASDPFAWLEDASASDLVRRSKKSR